MAATAALELDPRRTIVRAEGTGGPVLLALPIGWEDLAGAFDGIVSERAIEQAIERVEDALGHPKLDFARGLRVRGDETLSQMAQAAGLAGGSDVTLTAEAVEAMFARLAMQSAGALPREDRLPGDPRFRATLVIVRELMHHLNVQELSLDSLSLD
jgi:hypothetical protein